MKSPQNFASVLARIHNHFNDERHVVDRQAFKQRRSAALAEWQLLVAWTATSSDIVAPIGNKSQLD